MDNLLQKKTWARRAATGLIPSKESGLETPRPALSRVRGAKNARPSDIQPDATVAELAALSQEQPPVVDRAASEFDVRSLTSRKVIVTGRLSGRPIDLVATLQDDGRLSIQGFSGTLPTALTISVTGGSGVQIHGRRDGVSVQAVIVPRSGGSFALTERRGAETFLSVGGAEMQKGMVERLSIGLPADMLNLFKATMLYLTMR